MKTFRTVCRIPTLIIVLGFWTLSHAQTDPYVDWVFDFEQAQKGDDAEAVTKLITSQPALAQVWFYGFVYDVVNKGVPVNEQAAIRSRCDLIARTLADMEPSEQGPQRVMERLGADMTQTLLQALRLEEERWSNAGPELGMLPLQLSVINNPVQAGEIFYRALFKAAKWKTKLGGVDKAAKYVTIARRLASGFALAFGDDRYWRGLATYLGQKSVPLERLSFVEETLGKALNQQISEEATEAYRGFERAFALISKTRQDSLLVGLVMNGLAASATRANKAPRGLSLREQLAAGIRPLQLQSLTQLINGQLIKSYLTVGKLDQARRGMESFAKTLDESRLQRHQIAILILAVERFETESRRALADGKLDRSIRFGQASVSLLERLIKPAYGDAYFLRNDVEGARLKHQGRLADSYLRLADVHQLRGDYPSVDAALSVVQELYRGPLSDRAPFALDLELIKIKGLLEQGLFDETENALDALRAAEGIRDETIAAAHQLSALQFYLRGSYAPAFAHANEGLTHLHARNVKAPALYGSLHRVAALTLEAAGFTSQAMERWTWVEKFAPSFEVSVQQARLLARGGELEKAAEKLEPYFDSEHGRETTVIQSCLLASTSRYEEARASLSVLVPQLSLPTSRRFRAAGYACLAQLDAKANQYRDALKRIAVARRSLKGFPTPNLRWRLDLINARVLSAMGQYRPAMSMYEAAFKQLELNQYGSASASSGLFDFVTGPRLSLDSMYEEAATVALKLAQKTSRSARGSLSAKAATWLRLHRGLEVGPGLTDYQKLSEELETIEALRRERTKMYYLAGRLENKALSQRRQAELGRTYLAAHKQLTSLVTTRIQQAKTLGNPYRARLPECAGERACVYYLVGSKLSYAVVLVDGKYRLYTLPGSQRLAEVNAKLDALISAEPTAWTPTKRKTVNDPNFAVWKRLRDHGKTLIPFMYDREGKRLRGRSIDMFLDGVLMRTAFDALVIDSPARRQSAAKLQGPAYFSTVTSPTYIIGEAVASDAFEGQAIFVQGTSPAKLCEGESLQDCVTAGAAAALKSMAANVPESSRKTVKEMFDVTRREPAIVLGVPFNVSEGSVIAGQQSIELGKKTTTGELVALLSHWHDDPSKNERGLTQLWGELSRRGLQGVALYRGRSSGEEPSPIQPITKGMADQSSLMSGVRQWMLSRANSSVNPTEGGAAHHHPYFWAHWQLFGTPADWKVKPVESTPSTSGENSQATTSATEADPKSSKPVPSVEDPFSDAAEASSSESQPSDKK